MASMSDESKPISKASEGTQEYHTVPAEHVKLFEEIREQFPGEELGREKWQILTVGSRSFRTCSSTPESNRPLFYMALLLTR
jgi:hypothetical protein